MDLLEECGVDRSSSCGCARVCTQAGDSTPRYQAVQPSPGHAGNGLGHRLWAGQGRRSAEPDEFRRYSGHTARTCHQRRLRAGTISAAISTRWASRCTSCWRCGRRMTNTIATGYQAGNDGRTAAAGPREPARSAGPGDDCQQGDRGDPGRRYSTAGELSADLQRFLDDEPILARRQSQTDASCAGRAGITSSPPWAWHSRPCWSRPPSPRPWPPDTSIACAAKRPRLPPCARAARQLAEEAADRERAARQLADDEAADRERTARRSADDAAGEARPAGATPNAGSAIGRISPRPPRPCSNKIPAQRHPRTRRRARGASQLGMAALPEHARRARLVIPIPGGAASGTCASPSGNEIAVVAGKDSQVYRFRSGHGQDRGYLRPRSSAPGFALGYNPNGQELAALGRDRKIHLWDLLKGRESAVLVVEMECRRIVRTAAGSSRLGAAESGCGTPAPARKLPCWRSGTPTKRESSSAPMASR